MKKLVLLLDLFFLVSLALAQNDPLERAESFVAKGDYPSALEVFNKILVEKPGFASAYLGRATVYEALRKPDKALVDYASCLELEPTNWEARFGRAIILFQLERFELSLRDFETLLQTPQTQTNRIYYRRSAHSSGIDQITTSQSAGFHSQVLNYLGMIYTKLEDCDRALMILDSAIRLSPAASEYYVNRALVKEALHDTTSINDYERALQLDPTNSLARSNLASSKRTQPDSEKHFTQAIEKDSLLVYPYIERGYLRMNNRNYSGALGDFNAAIKLRKDDPELWLNQGVIKEKLNDLQGAVDDFTVAIELKHDFEKA
ncbi:MAG: tetratricopeptide repeat protein, partial [Flammeovirgaceae bacterium]|nr:tetratricopeptide repeat protein [Flammeovirgaceae bacterium]